MRDHSIVDVLSSDPTWFEQRIATRLAGYPDPTSCWTWTAAISKGYGVVRLPAGPTVLTHRAAWLALVGPIPVGLVLDHDGPDGCHNRACANPAHLQTVTQQVNTANGPFTHACKTHCKAGHPLGGDNALPSAALKGYRTCRRCSIEDHRALTEAAHSLGMTRAAYCATYGWSARTARELIAATTVERNAG